MSTGRTSPEKCGLYIVFSCLRVPQLVCIISAFFLVLDMGIRWGDISSWIMFSWCFCIIGTLTIVILELYRFPTDFPFCWYNFSITYACYAALICLSASIFYPITYIKFLPYDATRNRAIAATVFSCIACVVYVMEVACVWECYKLKEIPCFVHTMPGLLKVLETFVACVIFAFLSNTSLYIDQPALEWCVAVYSICFILAVLALLMDREEWENRLPISFPVFHLGLNLLSILLHFTALVLWLLYQFDEKYGGQPQQSSDVNCIDRTTNGMCAWEQRLAVAVLTAANLLTYMADLGYWAHQVSVGTGGQPTDS
ncbi:PREDICTED: myeloid-associated differentiation marker-like [Bison bison bison]|uniref:Myeloid-associated differentiation marker-like n=1 Tax=Bison bison bison TaxID=43346 RepID=A0A6P3H816_BISBB|nr:PREDICTED: myeloid-associated differentiation marker-like [Bison bison bison]